MAKAVCGSTVHVDRIGVAGKGGKSPHLFRCHRDPGLVVGGGFPIRIHRMAVAGSSRWELAPSRIAALTAGHGRVETATS